MDQNFIRINYKKDIKDFLIIFLIRCYGYLLAQNLLMMYSKFIGMKKARTNIEIHRNSNLFHGNPWYIYFYSQSKLGQSLNLYNIGKYIMKQILTIGLSCLFLIGCINTQKMKPNFIIFIADDVSWNDFSCYDINNAQTPNIDKLAANGIKFTNVYLTASSCSPSRNSIITGRYPHNTGAAELHTEPPLEMLSLPEVLKKNNYYTVQAGKFHMGKYAKRGFDISYDDKDGGSGKKINGNWENLLFSALAEAVEITALQRGVERWDG